MRTVLVAVEAAGIDRGTEHLMTGRPYLVRLAGFGLTKPKQPVLGFDVAGTVVAVGAAVNRFAVGDEVFGIATGSVAQFAVAKADKLSHKPANVPFDAAAASGVSGSTAPGAGSGHRRAGGRPASWSSAPRAGWAPSPCRSPPRSAPPSTASPAENLAARALVGGGPGIDHRDGAHRHRPGLR
ncbi:MAG: alcohol dehydrogenase catalytic domain-containing protein [Acidimicrobiales bacterium]